MHTAAVETMAEWIVTDRFAAGTALPVESQLCVELGVSRTVVREAIKTLSAKGMIEVAPKVGSRVRAEDAWQMFDPQVLRWRLQHTGGDRVVEDLTELRMLLEPSAAAIAAQRANWSERRAIRDAYAQMERTVADREAFEQADRQFHKLVLLACHNAFLVGLAPLIETLISTTLELYDDVGWDGAHVERAGLPLHRQMMQAIFDAQPDAAAAAARGIISRAYTDMASGSGSEPSAR